MAGGCDCLMAPEQKRTTATVRAGRDRRSARLFGSETQHTANLTELSDRLVQSKGNLRAYFEGLGVVHAAFVAAAWLGQPGEQLPGPCVQRSLQHSANAPRPSGGHHRGSAVRLYERVALRFWRRRISQQLSERGHSSPAFRSAWRCASFIRCVLPVSTGNGRPPEFAPE